LLRSPSTPHLRQPFFARVSHVAEASKQKKPNNASSNHIALHLPSMSNSFSNAFETRPFDSASRPALPGTPGSSGLFPNAFRAGGRPGGFSRFDSMARNTLPNEYNRNRSTSFTRAMAPFRGSGAGAGAGVGEGEGEGESLVESLLHSQGIRRDILVVLLIALVAGGLWAWYYYWCKSHYERRAHGRQCACRSCKGVQLSPLPAAAATAAPTAGKSVSSAPAPRDAAAASPASPTVRNPFHANASSGASGVTKAKKTKTKTASAARRSCRA